MALGLRPCVGCNRHVRISERGCPFCGEDLALFEPIEELRLLTRLDRGRMVALGALLSAAGIAIGCREAPVAVPPAPAPQEQPLEALPSATTTAPSPAASSASAPSTAPPPTTVAQPVAPAPTHAAKPQPTASARPTAPVAAYGAPPSMNRAPDIEPSKK